MHVKKQTNIENFIRKIGRNNTPIRSKSPKLQNHIGSGKPLVSIEINQTERDLSPNKLNATKKPTISLMRGQSQRNLQIKQISSPRNNIKFCNIHPTKNAQFLINIDNESIWYCSKCAAQLASQGFQVTRINSIQKTYTSGEKQLITKPRQVPYYPQLESNPFYQQISKFLNSIYHLQKNHYSNINEFQILQNDYKYQITLTQEFYNNLLSLIKQMKEDHLLDLIEEQKKFSQIADIQSQYLRQNLKDIDSIRNDIEQNIEDIVKKLNQKQLEQILNDYQNQMRFYRHKVEEQTQRFQNVPKFTKQDINDKLQKTLSYLTSLWNQKQEQKNAIYQPYMSIRSIHNKLPTNREQTYEELGACRALLFEQDSNLNSKTSPQFKNI